MTGIMLDDRRVELLRMGEGEPILYLHGLADVHSVFEPGEPPPLLSQLAAGREVLAPAHPGYEGSGELGVHADAEDYAFHLLDVVDELQLDAVDMVGASLGGWLAVEFALRHPARVRRLVLVNPLGLHVPRAKTGLFFGAAAPRGIGGFAEVRSMLFADAQSAVATEALPDDMSRERQRRWFGGLAAAARLGWRGPELRNPKLRGRLRRVTIPTLLLWGKHDRISSVEHARAWERELPDAELVLVPDAGHSVPLERPDVAFDWISSYLAHPSAPLTA
jgi:pimeloyl-ACP methyl ester carboxylesterase